MKGIHVRTMGSVCSCQEQSILVTVVSAMVQDSSVQDVKRVSNMFVSRGPPTLNFPMGQASPKDLNQHVDYCRL